MEERAKTLYRAGAGSRTSPRSRSRRLGLLAIALGVILVLIIGACIGPLRDYRHSLGALQLKDRDIAKLTTENKAMEAEVARLGDKTHLEALARRDLD